MGVRDEIVSWILFTIICVMFLLFLGCVAAAVVFVWREWRGDDGPQDLDRD